MTAIPLTPFALNLRAARAALESSVEPTRDALREALLSEVFPRWRGLAAGNPQVRDLLLQGADYYLRAARRGDRDAAERGEGTARPPQPTEPVEDAPLTRTGGARADGPRGAADVDVLDLEEEEVSAEKARLAEVRRERWRQSTDVGATRTADAILNGWKFLSWRLPGSGKLAGVATRDDWVRAVRTSDAMIVGNQRRKDSELRAIEVLDRYKIDKLEDLAQKVSREAAAAIYLTIQGDAT